jgi:hypothetical protein
MRTKDLPLLILLVVGISFLLSVTFLQSDVPHPGQVTLRGTVAWVAKDENNRITHGGFVTETEEYLVAGEGKGGDLLELLQRRVDVNGKVTQDRSGGKQIHVSDFKLVPQ